MVEQLMQALRAGAYQPGDKLPPERELAEQMEVGRTSVREGLAALAMQGIVRIKHGNGTYVLRAPEDTEPAQPLSLFEDVGPWEVTETRRAVEDMNVKLAVERADERDLDHIKTYLDEMASAAKAENIEKYMDANMDFHLALAEATHNRLLSQMTQHLINAMESSQEMRLNYYLSNPRHPQHLLAYHQAIFEAIKARDAEPARSAMAEHFDYFEQTTKELIGSV